MARGWNRTAARKRVLVNTKNGSTLRGVLWAERGGLLILKGAELVEKTGATRVDGEAVVPVSNVEFVQVLPPEV